MNKSYVLSEASQRDDLQIRMWDLVENNLKLRGREDDNAFIQHIGVYGRMEFDLLKLHDCLRDVHCLRDRDGKATDLKMEKRVKKSRRCLVGQRTR